MYSKDGGGWTDVPCGRSIQGETTTLSVCYILLYAVTVVAGALLTTIVSACAYQKRTQETVQMPDIKRLSA